MLTSDHTRYRVKYLKRFKGAPPKIVVQRTITCLEYTGHPLTEIYFKTLDVIDLTRVFRGHKLTVNNITLQEATEEFRKLFNYFLCSYGIKFNEVEIRLHNHPRKSPYLAVRPRKEPMTTAIIANVHNGHSTISVLQRVVLLSVGMVVLTAITQRVLISTSYHLKIAF